jgi:hypothetical protein
MPKTVADYEDAVRRITRSDVPDDATTEAEVRAALSASDSPQVTAEIASEISESIVTEERVIEAIESTGELPSESEIGAIANVSDDYDLSGRIAEVTEAVDGRVATVEEVDRAVSERRESSSGPTFREEVETAVSEVGRDQEFVGASEEQVADEQAQRIGAPPETSFRREATQTVAQSEQVTPSEVVDDTGAKTPVQVIRDESGETVAATGGPGGEVSRQVADEVGAEYMSTEEVVDEMSTAGTGDSVDLTLRGRKIGEVDV